MGRIILNKCAPVDPSFCWSADWLIPYQSAYCLLSTFALWNSLRAKDLVLLFVPPGAGVRVKMLKSPNLPLWDEFGFGRESFREIMSVSDAAFSQAFLFPFFDKDFYKECRTFRYCPKCMKFGYHATVFQLQIIEKCPTHNVDLVDRCPACKRRIDYKLTRSVFSKPFCCSHCHYDFSGNDLDLEFHFPRAESVAKIARLTEELALQRRLFHCAVKIERHCEFYRDAQVEVSPMQPHRGTSGYLDFLHGVILDLLTDESQSKRSNPRGTIVLKYIASGELGSKRKTAKCRSGAALAHRPWYASDDQFWSILPIYKSIRRHIWKLLGDHRACSYATARKMCWNPRIEIGPKHPCPAAFAFIQWRCFWEGIGTPERLFEIQSHAPYRLLIWLSDAAPLCPVEWTSALKERIAHRVFAMDCINSFRQMISVSRQQSLLKSGFDWRKGVGSHALTYWAVSKGIGDECKVVLEVKSWLDIDSESFVKHSKLQKADAKMNRHASKRFLNILPR